MAFDRTSPRFRALAALLTGLVLATTQAPLGFWWLLPVGIAALYILWTNTTRLRAAFWTGWFAGLAYFAGTLFWMVEPFLVDAATFGWLIPIALPLMAGGMALFWGSGLALGRWLAGGSACAPFAMAGGWMVGEALRGFILTGFPWSLLGYALVDTPTAQTAAYIGVNGLTLLVMLTGCLFGAALRTPNLHHRIACGLGAFALVAGTWIAGSIRLAQPISPRADPLMVGIVQPNVPQAEKWRPDLREAQFADLLEKTRELSAQGADVVIWPEAATPILFEQDVARRAAVARNLRTGGVVLTGGIRITNRGAPDQKVYNSLLAIGADGALLQTYDKQHLVPFGEYLPFDSLLTAMGLRTIAALPGGFTSGRGQNRALTIATLPPFGAMICYEAIFADEVLDRSAAVDWLVHVTNDAWFGRVAGPQQHLAQTRFRAIERGVPIARSANTGISAMIDSNGTLMKSLPLNTPGTLLAPLPGNRVWTFYHRLEEFLFAILLIGVIIKNARKSLFFNKNV